MIRRSVKTPEIFRISYLHDKLGRQTGVVFFFKLELKHRYLIKNLLKSFDLSKEDETMLRTSLRVGDYSEFDRDRLVELRRMYIEDNL